MSTDQWLLFLLAAALAAVWTGLQMTQSKAMGTVLIAGGLCWFWWLFLPLLASKYPIPNESHVFWLFGGWIVALLISVVYGWWIYEPVTAALSPQISSTNQSGGIAANYGSIGNIVIQTPPEKPAKIEPRTFIPYLPLSTQNDMVVRLRDLIPPFGGQPKVAVMPTTAASYPFARTLTAVFESAGWEAQFQDPPRDYHVHVNPMNRGMGVTGANTHLVMTVAGILKAAGCMRVSAVAQEWQRGTPPPQWNQDQHFVRIEISYPR